VAASSASSIPGWGAPEFRDLRRPASTWSSARRSRWRRWPV